MEIIEWIDAKQFCLSINSVADKYPLLKSFLINGRINLGDPEALFAYNSGLLYLFTGFTINLPDKFLVPAICLRRTYLFTLQKLYPNLKTILDVGTGASAIIGLLAVNEGLKVIGTEINSTAFEFAKQNILNNGISAVDFQLVKSQGGIIKGVLDQKQLKNVQITMCYPPFYPEDVPGRTSKKSKGFLGNNDELFGGETGLEFTSQYIMEALDAKIPVVTVLLNKENYIEDLLRQKHISDMKIKVIAIKAGTRQRYLLIIENASGI